MTDNAVANGVTVAGGITVRFFEDTNAVMWAGSVTAFVAGGVANNWNIQYVSSSNPLPVSSGGPSGQSLASQAGPGPSNGTPVNFGGAFSRVGAQCKLSGTPFTTCLVNLMGTIDGTNYSQRARWSYGVSGSTDADGSMIWSDGPPMTGAYLQLLSSTGGDGTSRVSGSIAAAR